jgi:alpha-1,2-mannosyltransferase
MNPAGRAVPPAPIKEGGAAPRVRDRRANLAVALEQGTFGLFPVLVFIWLAVYVLAGPSNKIAVDFHDAFYVAGHRVLHGGDPYAWTTSAIRNGVAFVYPALSALLFVPFALISSGAAGIVFTLICMALAPLTLWVLGIRDWRIYGITLIWQPVFSAWQTANESILLVCLVALVWRYRDRALVAGLLTAVAISLKPFVWPLALWLLITRRWRASGYGLVVGLVINLISWSVVGFNNISVYQRDSGTDARDSWRIGYSAIAAAGHLGATRTFGDLLLIVISVALVVGAVYIGFIKRREKQALILVVALMLAASPLVWTHYFVVLLIPMALARPRVNWLWALPILMWVCPPSLHVRGWQELIAWLVASTILVSASRTVAA